MSMYNMNPFFKPCFCLILIYNNKLCFFCSSFHKISTGISDTFTSKDCTTEKPISSLGYIQNIRNSN